MADNCALITISPYVTFTQHYNDVAQVAFNGSYIDVECDCWLDKFFQSQPRIYIQYAFGVISKTGEHGYIGFPEWYGDAWPPHEPMYEKVGAVGLWYSRQTFGQYARYWLYGNHYDSPFGGVDDIDLWGADEFDSKPGDPSTLHFNIVHNWPNGIIDCVVAPASDGWSISGNVAVKREPGVALLWYSDADIEARYTIHDIAVNVDEPLIIEIVPEQEIEVRAVEHLVIEIENPLEINLVPAGDNIIIEQYIEPSIFADVTFEKLPDNVIEVNFDGSYIDVPKGSWLDYFWQSQGMIPIQYALGVKIAHEIRIKRHIGMATIDNIDTTIYPRPRDYITTLPAHAYIGIADLDSINTTIYPFEED